MTPTERGLLAAVADWPNDALTRQVYADWLEAEGGGDGPRRGAFLRAWCELLPVNVRDLDGYAEGAERLEALAAGLDADWLAAVDAKRFHLVYPAEVCCRAEAFFTRFGGSAGLLDARSGSVIDDGVAWDVYYTTGSDPDLGRLRVDRATGRVHMMNSDGRPARTHHPDRDEPSEPDGRHP